MILCNDKQKGMGFRDRALYRNAIAVIAEVLSSIGSLS
jgi:hypothetical protein